MQHDVPKAGHSGKRQRPDRSNLPSPDLLAGATPTGRGRRCQLLGDVDKTPVSNFKAAADALKPGQSTAGAVETQYGYHFIEWTTR